MKVETRILSFSDSHATANDRVTGESSFVAFRATAVKHGFSFGAICQGIFKFFLHQTHSHILVVWANVDYNLGNFFDGTYFTVPKNGLYSFLANFHQASSSRGQVFLYLNDEQKMWAARGESDGNMGFITLNTTLQLVKNDKVDIRLSAGVSNIQDPMTTTFEGRLIARTGE